jgi:glycosyltransferase involved in cell wall biosynthesis
MKILFVNKYFYLRGGCEYVFFDTVKLFEERGHSAVFFSMQHPRNFPSRYEKFFASYNDYENASFSQKISAAGKLIYNFEAKKKIGQLLDLTRPDIVHINNMYHQLSPSILHSIKKRDIPVVMTLHDFKMVCPSYALDDGHGLCKACAGRQFYNCIRKRCMKGSAAMSGLVSLEMFLHHSCMHIYDLVDVCIAPSLFLKETMRAMGFDKPLVHLPNFIFLDQWTPQYDWQDDSIVYFGRLVPGKGLETLIDTIECMPDIRLKIIGEGPLRPLLEEKSKKFNRVSFLGYRKGDDLRDQIRRAKFVVFPAEGFENNPRTIIEAFALGKPVVASVIGGVPELVLDGKTGLLFKPGDRKSLASAISRLYFDNKFLYELGFNARSFVEKNMGSNAHYEKLMKIYSQVSNNVFQPVSKITQGVYRE